MAQIFEQALVAELASITALTAILGTQLDATQPAIFKSIVPQTWQFDADGLALTYTVLTKPKGQVLVSGDATATARVQCDIWGYSALSIKQALAALYNGINGVPGTWGDGSCVIFSVIHQNDSDADEPPQAGSNQVLYHSFSEYLIKYRLATGGG